MALKPSAVRWAVSLPERTSLFAVSTRATEKAISSPMLPIIPAISSVALALCSASLRTSSATTAKPRPASPARAASIAALSANKLVCPAMPLITSTMPLMFSDAAASLFVTAVISPIERPIFSFCATTSPSMTIPRLASSTAVCVPLFTSLALAVISSVPADISSMVAETVVMLSAFCVAPWAISSTLVTTCSRARIVSSIVALSSSLAAAKVWLPLCTCCTTCLSCLRIEFIVKPISPISSLRFGTTSARVKSRLPMHSSSVFT